MDKGVEVVVSASHCLHCLKKRASTVEGLAKSPCQVPNGSQTNWMAQEVETDNQSIRVVGVGM